MDPSAAEFKVSTQPIIIDGLPVILSAAAAAAAASEVTPTSSPAAPAAKATPKTSSAKKPPTPAAPAAPAGGDPGVEFSLQDRIVMQVEFYFSDANLSTDKFMLRHTGKHGTNPVALSVIAGFKRMKQLTTDLSVIVDALEKGSTKLIVTRPPPTPAAAAAPEQTPSPAAAATEEPSPPTDSSDPTPSPSPKPSPASAAPVDPLSLCTLARNTALHSVNLDAVKSRTVVAENITIEPLTIDAIKEHFAKCGEVLLVRICTPPATQAAAVVDATAAAGAAPAGMIAAMQAAQQHHPFKNDPILTKIFRTYALVEYATGEMAANAANVLTETNSWRAGMRVRVLGKVKGGDSSRSSPAPPAAPGASKDGEGGGGKGKAKGKAKGRGSGAGATTSAADGEAAGEGGAAAAAGTEGGEEGGGGGGKPPRRGEAPTEEDLQRIAGYKGFRRKSGGGSSGNLRASATGSPETLPRRPVSLGAVGGAPGSMASLIAQGAAVGAGLPIAPRGPDGSKGFSGGRGGGIVSPVQ